MHPNRADHANQQDPTGASIVSVNGLMVVGGVGLVTNLSDSAPVNNTVVAANFQEQVLVLANSLQVGSLIEVYASGTSSTDVNTAIDFFIRLGANFITQGLNTLSDNATLHWGIWGSAVVRSIGAAATFKPGMGMTYREKSAGGATAVFAVNPNSGVITFDSTVDNLIQCGVRFATANVLRTATLETLAVRVTNPATTVA